jgi:FkbM family methyltransferase
MKIFYDLGTHLFGGLEEFNKTYNFDRTWKIYCFEANPYTYELAKQKIASTQWLQDLDIELYNAAISDKEGTVEVDCYFDNNEQDYTDVGSNTFNLKNDYFKGIWPEMYDRLGETFCQTRSVPSICFSEFLDKNTKYGDEVHIKMDIEGGEFATLSEMVNNNTHTLVKQMYIEWHERFWPEELDRYTGWKNAIMERLIEDKIDAKIWW